MLPRVSALHSNVFEQIRKSPQARAFFQKSCKEVDAPSLQLLYWVKTRWASLFNFLDRILLLQQVDFDFVFSHNPLTAFLRQLTVLYRVQMIVMKSRTFMENPIPISS